ncbi:MAG: GTPase Era [Erysipelotrichaceae bacterium]
MFKSGFVAILGRPNAGKSTLINTILKDKVAIVSSKAQTTRNAIRGIYTTDDSQIIFIDTPGVHKPINKLGQQMNKTAISNAAGVDIIYLLLDASVEIGKGDQFLFEQVKQLRLPTFLVVTKIDLLTKEQLMKFLIKCSTIYDFEEIIPISSVKNDNIDKLLELTVNNLEEGVKYYPDDQIVDYPEQFIISEVVREKILYLTSEEVPHSVAVTIESIKRSKDSYYVNVLILVDRDSQKGIIIGKQGQMIKKIGTLARKDLQNILGVNLFLECYVRVEKNWRDKEDKLAKLGYIQIDEE